MIYLARCSECYSGFPDGHECYEPDKIILSGQSMGGYAAATAAPIVNPYALILMCPGAGMWFGCKDRAEAMEAKGITKADIEGLTFPTSFNPVSYTHLTLPTIA